MVFLKEFKFGLTTTSKLIWTSADFEIWTNANMSNLDKCMRLSSTHIEFYI